MKSNPANQDDDNYLRTPDFLKAKFKAAFYLATQLDFGGDWEEEIDMWAESLSNEVLSGMANAERPDKLNTGFVMSEKEPRRAWAIGWNEAIEHFWIKVKNNEK